MEFAKYYDVTSIMKRLIDSGKLISHTKGQYHSMFVCKDTLDIWVIRIQEGLNAEYEKDDTWLLERDKFDKREFAEYLAELNGKTIPDGWGRFEIDDFIDKKYKVESVLEAILMMDDERGLENWDLDELETYENCLEGVDSGYGIIDTYAEKAI